VAKSPSLCLALCCWLHAEGVCTRSSLVQALSLRTAHRGRTGIALLFHDHGTRRGEGSASRPGRSLPSGKTRYPLYKRLGGSQGRSGQMRKISPPTGIRFPDRPARSQSLYRLSYRASWKLAFLFLHVFSFDLFNVTTHLLTYLLTYLLHGAESFLRS
jgi:hypothetical protein